MAALCGRTLMKCGGQANTANQFQIPYVASLMIVMIAMLAGVLISLTGLNYLSGYFHQRGAARFGSLFLLMVLQE